MDASPQIRERARYCSASAAATAFFARRSGAGLRPRSARGGGKRRGVPWSQGGQGRESIASPEPAAGCHLQPLKKAPPEKMPSVASCRCSQEPKRHLADWGGSGAYVFIGLTLPCPRRKGWLQRAQRGRARASPKSQNFSSDPNAFPSSSPPPHSLRFVNNFLLDLQLSLTRPLFLSRGQKVLGEGRNTPVMTSC